MRSRLRRFFRTPKGLLILILALLAAMAAPHEGFRVMAPGFFGAIVVAGALDAVILRLRHRRWQFPDGAVLSAMIVAMVMSAQQPWHHTVITAALAIVSKYLVRTRAANVFNPAAVALFVTFFLFDTGQSWWGALPNLPWFAQAALVVTGVFIADRVNKMPLVLSFLGLFYLLFTMAAFAGDAARVAEVFRTPDLQAALFFAFIMLTDPPTSPVKYRDQIICGAIVAAVSFAVFEWIGAVYYLLAGTLVGNVWEAWRRVNRRKPQGFPHGIGGFLMELTPFRAR